MSGRSRSPNATRKAYKSYKYQTLGKYLNDAFSVALTAVGNVKNSSRPHIEEHMYETMVQTLAENNTSHTNESIVPAIKAFLNAKYANYAAYNKTLKPKFDPKNTYLKRISPGLLNKEIHAATHPKRGGATRRRRRA